MNTQASPVLPQDDVLTGLGLLLDSTAVAERLRESVGDLEEGVLFYLKYKPRTSCIAAYEFRKARSGERVVYHGKCFAPSHYPLASSKASHHRWTAPASGPPVVHWPEARTLLYAFPNDPRLDGLRILAKPHKLRRLVSGRLHLDSAQMVTDLVRYKPERRAVFKSWNRAAAEGASPDAAEFYWRVYGNGEGAGVVRRLAVLASSAAEHGVRTPRPYDYDPERQLLAMEALSGRPLDECLGTERAPAAVAAAADALARLHRLAGDSLSHRPVGEFIAAAAETTEMLSYLSEAAGSQASRVLQTLRRSVAELTHSTAFVHGDFHPGQVLVGDEGVGVLDFDRSHLGRPAADLGAFLAHLRVARLYRRLRDEARLAQVFVGAYAARSHSYPDVELRFWTALALLLLALEPFRRLEPDWPDKVRRILTAAEERLC